MNSLRRYCHRILPALLLLLTLAACNRKALVHHEYLYVSASETSLRDRVATLYNKVGTVHNGERVEVLEKQRRFLRVRTDSGQEGWIEERSLVPQDIYDQFQKLAADNVNTPVQAHGATRAELNMHVTPSRDAEHLYQLKDGEKVDILRRATAPKNPPKEPKAVTAVETKPNPNQKKSGKSASAAKGAADSSKASAGAPSKGANAANGSKANGSTLGNENAAKSATPGEHAEEPSAPPVMEDWYLVRAASGNVGWVLLRMIDLDIPLDIAQYAEGQRIIAYFVLNTVEEEGKQQAQYLVLLNEPKDGLAWDYNQIRVFTRNRARHRYETAYRERNLEGYLPVKVGHQEFGKEGDLPTFTIRKMNDDGKIVGMTYKMNGPIVKRVLTPEEEAAEKAKHQQALEERMKAINAYRAQHPGQTVHKRHKPAQ